MQASGTVPITKNKSQYFPFLFHKESPCVCYPVFYNLIIVVKGENQLKKPSIFGECLGQQLRLRRMELGLSQEKLEELSGLSPKMIGKIERGERIQKLPTLFKITSAMNISLDRLQEDVEKAIKSRD